jgi:O-methyltransferase
MDFGGGDVAPGAWDLRGGERTYLGYLDLAGQRVLEFGPATGYLTFFMERQGAEVVCFDIAPGLPQDIVPQLGHDLGKQRELSVAYAERVRNSWWYGHGRLGSKSQAVYGDIYGLPPDLGRFDVSTFGCTLMHLSKPFQALEQAAAVTDKAIVVTEPLHRVPPDEAAALMEFVPVDTTKTVVVWWLLTPGAVVRMLKVLGFFETRVIFHAQKYHPYHELDKPAVESLFFTVVGQRYKDMVPGQRMSPEQEQVEREVKRRWGPEPGERERLEAEIRSMKASLSWRLSRPVRIVGSVFRRLGWR